MSQPAADRPTEADYLFLVKGATTTHAALFLVGGIALVGIAIGGLVFSILTRADQLRMHSVTTVPMIMAVATIGRAWMLFRSPIQVSVGDDGLTLQGQTGTAVHCWNDIGWSKIEAANMYTPKRLVVFDVRGKKIVSLSDAFEDFDDMARLIQQRIDARQDETTQLARTQKNRKTAVLLMAGSIVPLLLAGFMVWKIQDDARVARLLKEQGVPGSATIVRRFTAPNGWTRRLEYEVTGENGQTAIRNAEVEPIIWEGLAGISEIAVIYVPQEPSISRLLFGEVEEKGDFLDTPAGGYLVAGVFVVMTLMCLGGAALQWKGWDLAFDPKTNRISLKRI